MRMDGILRQWENNECTSVKKRGTEREIETESLKQRWL